MKETKSIIECKECGARLHIGENEDKAEYLCPNCGSSKKNYRMKAENLKLTNCALDTFISHRLSELTKNSAPDFISESNWLNEFILKTIFHFNLQPKIRTYIFTFLRRSEAACNAYGEAKRYLDHYLETPNNVISPYFSALAQFEVSLSQCYQGFELLSAVANKNLYEPGDDSNLEKLQKVYVDSKHMDRMIRGDKLPPEATTGIWITNSGLESARCSISFIELHELLTSMNSLAEKICNRNQ